MSNSMEVCYDFLIKTGRAFAVTINHLDEDLRDALCVYYVVLRAVDTVEDDMTLPNDIKVTMLTSFEKYLADPTWRYTASNHEDGAVLEKFPIITQALRELPSKYRDIIVEQSIQFGQTMARFVGKELITMDDNTAYSGCITGVCLIGVVRLIAASGLEPEVQDTSLVVQLSIFVEKTNIIRDFPKDWINGSIYYPKDVWSKYVDNPGDFLKPDNCDKGVQCVNELVTDALQYAIPYLHFMKRLRSPSIIKFFGIHQVMAIATLERCYDNPKVLRELVKIGRVVTADIVGSVSCLGDVFDKVRHYTENIMGRVCMTSEGSDTTLDRCRHILNQIELLKSS